jgi:hypothetical protein
MYLDAPYLRMTRQSRPGSFFGYHRYCHAPGIQDCQAKTFFTDDLWF